MNPEPETPETEERGNFLDEAIDWVRAFGLGLRDTAKDMLEAGREGARQAYSEGWDRFDEKTKKGRYHRH